MRACGKTDVGLRRHENQDTFAVEQGKKLLIAVVCDGMGGAEGGQIASSVAVETFMKEMRALIRADMTAAIAYMGVTYGVDTTRLLSLIHI